MLSASAGIHLLSLVFVLTILALLLRHTFPGK